jgi:uncharacterized membrane protein YqaE (UPF0057 family)
MGVARIFLTNTAYGGIIKESKRPRTARFFCTHLRNQNSSVPSLIVLYSVGMDILRIIIAIVLPPLGVFLQVGFSGQFFLNILLTLLGYIPGIIHAVWIISRR